MAAGRSVTDSGLHALVPPATPPTALSTAAAPVADGAGAVEPVVGLGGVTPDPQAGVRILGPAVGLSAALASAAAGREEAANAERVDGTVDGDGSGPGPAVVAPVVAGAGASSSGSSPEPADESAQIARELWPNQADPGPADDGDGLADLHRTPLKIVTLEDLQEAARQAAADGEASAPTGASPDVIDLGGDHG